MKINITMRTLLLKHFFLILVVMGTTSYTQGQFNPYADRLVMGNAGVGISGYGIPLYVSVDFPVANNVTVGGGISFQTHKESINLGVESLRWRHTIFGVSARGDYHFNELIGIPEQWDLYAGLSLEYYSWTTKLKEGSGGTYTGSGSGGLGLSARVGGRYFFKENLGVNLELGGGSVLSSGRIGITLLF